MNERQNRPDRGEDLATLRRELDEARAERDRAVALVQQALLVHDHSKPVFSGGQYAKAKALLYDSINPSQTDSSPTPTPQSSCKGEGA